MGPIWVLGAKTYGAHMGSPCGTHIFAHVGPIYYPYGIATWDKSSKSWVQLHKYRSTQDIGNRSFCPTNSNSSLQTSSPPPQPVHPKYKLSPPKKKKIGMHL